MGTSALLGALGLVAGAAAPLGMAAAGIVGDLTKRSIPVIYPVVGALAALAVLATSADPAFRDSLATDFEAGAGARSSDLSEGDRREQAKKGSAPQRSRMPEAHPDPRLLTLVSLLRLGKLTPAELTDPGGRVGRVAKRKRQQAVLDVIRKRRVHNQDELRQLLLERGIDVTQATLSRDLRELRIAKLPRAEGESFYVAPAESETASPDLERLLPHLMVSAEGVGNLIVVKTLVGGAQAVAEAIDMEDWPEVLGTLAGDDTILVIIRDAAGRESLIERIDRLSRD